MHRKQLFIVTALVEAGAGLALLAMPDWPFALLLGVDRAAPEAMFMARIAAAALLAISVACWMARNDHRTPAQFGLLIGLLVYNVGVSALLALAGTIWKMAGIALWPAIGLHTALAGWCCAALRGGQAKSVIP